MVCSSHPTATPASRCATPVLRRMSSKALTICSTPPYAVMGITA
jgi:hypothetical protein